MFISESNYIELFATYFLVVTVNSTIFDPDIHRFKITRLEKCAEEKQKYQIFIRLDDFIVIKQTGNYSYIQGTIQVIRPILINLRLNIHGILCDGPSHKRCKHMFVRTFGFVCRKLNYDDKPWYPFVKGKFRCPLGKGNYTIGDTAIMNINTLSLLPLKVGYWVIKVYGYSGSNIVLCVYSEMCIFVDDGGEGSDEESGSEEIDVAKTGGEGTGRKVESGEEENKNYEEYEYEYEY